MAGFDGVEEKKYVLLKDLKVELRKDGDEEVANGCFTLCFWLYIHNCASFPSVILHQKCPEFATGAPFLWLNEKKKMMLFPLHFLHQEAPDPDNVIPWMEVPCASTEMEFPEKKWVHVGCEVLSDILRLHMDGKIVGEKHLTCSLNTHPDALERMYLASIGGNEDGLQAYVYGMDVLSPTSPVEHHYVKDPPVQLAIDHSSASEIEEDSDGVWSIVGGKCRRIFSVDVILLDAFGNQVNKELEVVASLLYADNEAPVENTNDAEAPLFTGYDGIEFDSHDRPCKLISGRASFKLKISQLSSKCDNRLFRIRFDIPKMGRCPFLETFSVPIRCISRSRNTRTTSTPWRKASSGIYLLNGSQSPDLDDGPVELLPSIVCEAKPSPSSKRIKLGQDKPFAMFEDNLPLKQGSKEYSSRAWITNEENNAYGTTMDWRPENYDRAGQLLSCFR
ncbi:SH2 domain protein B [Forsythia ovata]|uniref:SH2 domain protein B n=1 Tax=Forsythia ovata TaxID=205694 RepID=A0ABD1S739_9LAMI